MDEMDNDEISEETTEVGSDELLSDDDLRLPEGASPLVRLHAVRAWLTRRQKETTLEIGKAALALQELQEQTQPETRLRRRERETLAQRIQQAQQDFQDAQQSLNAYEEAATLLEDYVDHTTPGPRLLVEYYLALEDLIQSGLQEQLPGEQPDESSPRLQALLSVLQRVEHVSAPREDD